MAAVVKELRADFEVRPGPDDLFHQQREVNEFWSRSEPLNAEYLEFLKNPTALAEWEKKLEENLPRVRGLLGNDIRSLREDDDILRIYERVFMMASAACHHGAARSSWS